MLRRLLLWIVGLILLLIVLSLMFGGFTKGTKAAGAGCPPRSGTGPACAAVGAGLADAAAGGVVGGGR